MGSRTLSWGLGQAGASSSLSVSTIIYIPNSSSYLYVGIVLSSYLFIISQCQGKATENGEKQETRNETRNAACPVLIVKKVELM